MVKQYFQVFVDEKEKMGFIRYYTNYLPLKKKKIKWGLYVTTHNIL